MTATFPTDARRIPDSTDRAGRILDVYAQRLDIGIDTETQAASLVADLMHYVHEFYGITAAELLDRARDYYDEDRYAVAQLDATDAAPTVPEHAPEGMPEPPTCPECGLIPDRYRASCLTCLTGPSAPSTPDALRHVTEYRRDGWGRLAPMCPACTAASPRPGFRIHAARTDAAPAH